MRVISRITGLTLIGITSLGSLIGCSDGAGSGNVTVNSSSVDQGIPATYNMNKYPLNKLVCNPFGDAAPPKIEMGINAQLFVAQNGVRYNTAQEYVDLGQQSSQSLFFTDMNVPTRMFNTGFSTSTSGVVKDDAGAMLIEWFGMSMSSNVGLAEGEPEGDYEIALLADDGVILDMAVDDIWQTIISNDNLHPTKMGCASRTIHMTKDTRIPMRMVYFQGPRYHIANVMMWRQASVAGQDQECNKQGNNYFFNPNNGSVPLAPYNGLLNRGWKPLHAGNFYLSADVYNPCTAGTTPIISNLVVQNLVETSVWLTWSTNIPATSQMILTDIASGAQILTESDNVLRTEHSVQVNGLDLNVTYRGQAVSVSADLGKAFSDPILFTTF